MAAEGVGVLPQGVEVGQRVVFFIVWERVRVGDVGKGLVHHHDDADGFPLAGGVPGFPGLRHGAAEALGPVHQIGGEMVAEGVGEAQVVEDGGDVLGVADVEGLIEVLGGVDRQDQAGQGRQAGGGAQNAAQPPPEPFHGKGLAAKEKAQGDESGGDQHHRPDLDGGEVDVVVPQGAAHLLEQGEVPGKHRLVPDLDLHPVGDGQGPGGQVHQRRAEEDVSKRRRRRQYQQSHRQGVQDDEQGLAEEAGQQPPEGVGLAPEGQQGDSSGQQHGRKQAEGQGQAALRRREWVFQTGHSLKCSWLKIWSTQKQWYPAQREQ